MTGPPDSIPQERLVRSRSRFPLGASFRAGGTVVVMQEGTLFGRFGELKSDVREFEHVQAEGDDAVGRYGDRYADEGGAVLHFRSAHERESDLRSFLLFRPFRLGDFLCVHRAEYDTMAEANYRTNLSSCSSLPPSLPASLTPPAVAWARPGVVTDDSPAESNPFARFSSSISGYIPVRSGDRTNEEEAYFALSRWERFIGFLLCCAGASVCFAVAFFIGLPLLAFNPRKFAVSSTYSLPPARELTNLEFTGRLLTRLRTSPPPSLLYDQLTRRTTTDLIHGSFRSPLGSDSPFQTHHHRRTNTLYRRLSRFVRPYPLFRHRRTSSPAPPLFFLPPPTSPPSLLPNSKIETTSLCSFILY